MGKRVAPAVHAAVSHALDLVQDGQHLGLGSGHAAGAFVALLGERVRNGLRVTAVATSKACARAARAHGIRLVDLGETELDLTVDGADEVAPNLDLIKGWGNALANERVVASASKRQVIVVGHEKLVRRLGERGRIPVEVIPLARGLVARRLRDLGLNPTVRMDAARGRMVLTDNGNVTIDCAPRGGLADASAARELESELLAMTGVVDTGLFLGTAHSVIVGYGDGRVEVRERQDP